VDITKIPFIKAPFCTVDIYSNFAIIKEIIKVDKELPVTIIMK